MRTFCVAVSALNGGSGGRGCSCSLISVPSPSQFFHVDMTLLSAASCYVSAAPGNGKGAGTGGSRLHAVVLWSHGLPVRCVACCVAYNCLARCQPLHAH